ncbi:MAG: UDP-N-acetylmuramoyl-tripeptide--D-alanyl-D-alanine ligase [Porphyromonas sp.]|nr:UDP-N-acetylmuramoyl-tripeptide--D-alanyl-D-alanine ligase [Porphyromonas sp.]
MVDRIDETDETAVLYDRYLSCEMEVCTDSRKVVQGSLFFALAGENFDGNRYALSALDKGAKYAVVSDREVAERDPRCVCVSDTLMALQRLARHHRMQMPVRSVIGITGTNGKTTTKELLATILSGQSDTLYTEGNLNNHIGVPLTLLRLRPHHRFAVIEMGASKPGDIKELVEIALPTVGLITNIGRAHLEGFGSVDGILQTKSELFDHLTAAGNPFALNLDDPLLFDKWHGLQAFGYALHNREGDLYGEVLSNDPYLRLKVSYRDNEYEVDTRLTGVYNAYNVLAALSVALMSGVTLSDAVAGVAAYRPSNHRSQLIVGTHGRKIIADAYNANPSSMQAALHNLYSQKARLHVAILGDMRELGADSLAEHQSIVAWLNRHTEIETLLCGELFESVATDGMRLYRDVAALLTELQQSASIPPETTILVKGSNGIGLEKVLPLLTRLINQ